MVLEYVKKIVSLYTGEKKNNFPTKLSVQTVSLHTMVAHLSTGDT